MCARVHVSNVASGALYKCLGRVSLAALSQGFINISVKVCKSERRHRGGGIAARRGPVEAELEEGGRATANTGAQLRWRGFWAGAFAHPSARAGRACGADMPLCEPSEFAPADALQSL